MKHVVIHWKSEADDSSMHQDLYGVQMSHGIPWRWAHVEINMNADRLLLFTEKRVMRDGEDPVSPFRGMWGTFLHECCHAYLGILTGTSGDDVEDAEGYDGGHGCYFQRCIHAVDRSARAMLGIAACCHYGTRDDLPQKEFDPRNHKVIPKDPKMPKLKRISVRQIIRTCSHMVKVLRRA